VRFSMPLALPLVFLTLVGCQNVQQHAKAVDAAQGGGDRLTVGKVQREIRIGMTNAEVIEVMGSPNIVSTDDQRREVWVYDKVATTRVYSQSEGGIITLILGGAVIGGGIAGGGIGGSFSSGAGAESSSQKTLTVIVKFDATSKVRDFSYRSSQF